MFRFDHHIHTTRLSPDSIIEPHQLLEAARSAGLTGVVITEHDELWDPDELAELQAQAGELVVLAGVEVSAREGHFLVYGLPHLQDVEPGIRLADLLQVVRGHGAAIVGAHPHRWGQDFGAILREHGPVFDALELVSNNVDPQTRRLTASACEAYGLAATGSSDAHEPAVVGVYHTEFPAPIRTMADFVAALRARSGRPRHRQGVPLSCGPTD